MGRTRGCSVTECDKYVKGKPLKKRKASGGKMVDKMLNAIQEEMQNE